VLPSGFFADFLWNNLYKDSRKFYFVKNLYIIKPYHDHRSVYYRDSSLELIIGVVALVSDRNGPCRGCLLIYRSLLLILWFLWVVTCNKILIHFNDKNVILGPSYTAVYKTQNVSHLDSSLMFFIGQSPDFGNSKNSNSVLKLFCKKYYLRQFSAKHRNENKLD
jgi:hypothetical protein